MLAGLRQAHNTDVHVFKEELCDGYFSIERIQSQPKARNHSKSDPHFSLQKSNTAHYDGPRILASLPSIFLILRE